MSSSNQNNTQTLLRLLPLLTSTASLTFAGNQHWIFRLFSRPDLQPQSGAALPSWFAASFRIGMPKVVGLLTASMVGAAWNAATTSQTGAARRWYVAGGVLAGAHLLFVPAVAPRVRGIVEATTGAESIRELKGWLRVNAVRTLSVDLGAWLCFVVGAVKALGPL